MGWKVNVNLTVLSLTVSQSAFAGYGLKSDTLFKGSGLYFHCRNPLSLDMGWKAVKKQKKSFFTWVAIRFRWIWVEKGDPWWGAALFPASRNPLSLDMGWKVWKMKIKAKYSTVAIRFRWIWVEKWRRVLGRKEANTVAIRFRWIWVEKKELGHPPLSASFGRNPLSLDMGWKVFHNVFQLSISTVAIRFRWIWVEKSIRYHMVWWNSCRNPLSLDMGWKEI